MALYALLVVHARKDEDLELNSVALWDDQVVSGKGSGDATGGSCGHVPVGRGSDLSLDESSPWVGGCTSSSSSSSSPRAVVRAVPVRRGPACPTPGGPPYRAGYRFRPPRRRHLSAAATALVRSRGSRSADRPRFRVETGGVVRRGRGETASLPTFLD